MIAGQKLSTTNNIQVLLFPLSYMYISQGEDGEYSHQGSLNMDFLGWGENGRIYNCPYYAPCDMTCVYQSQSGAYNIWESDKPVYLADNTTDYVTLMCIHDESLLPLGSKVKQGDILGHTGAAGQATGDHVHLNIARGIYEGQEQLPTGVWQLKNSIHLYNAMYVNDTVLVEDYNYPWKTYDGGVIPPTPVKKTKFPWVLYARKLREKRR